MEPLDEYHALIAQFAKVEEELSQAKVFAFELRRSIVIFLAELEERVHSEKESLKKGG